MASIIRIKRSSGTAKPASLNWGEMAYVTGVGQFGGVNQYKDRVFLGDDGTNVNPIAGHYYTSMMEHSPGAVAGVTNSRNSDGGIIAILDNNRKIDLWNVDNLTLDANTLSSSNTNGDIILNPNGSGEVMIPDDTFLGFGGGANGTDPSNATIEYDENGTDELKFAGANVRFTNSKVFVDGDLEVQGGNSKLGNIRIENNIIASLAGAGNKIFIDPYPDGLSNEGDVIIKGNLQVDGTTTTVNSTQTTVNDPIMMVGDTTSTRTVMVTVQSGVSTVIVDQVTGIAVNDTLLHSSFSASGITTVTAINSGAKMLTFQGTTIAGISTQTEISVVHATDTNTDRGLGFTYNTGIGTANSTEGFFGLDDSSIASSSAGTGNHGTHGDNSRRWTYVPDATISASVVTGTKGFLDIKGIYYQAGNFASGGVVWFDDTGLQRSTNAPQTPVITSKQVLTAITKVTLSSLSAAITVAVGDIVKQDTTGAFGVVETAVTGGNTVNLIGVEGTFNTSNNLRREGQSGAIANLSSVPGAATNVYVNKPHWTSTLDGGTF
tara:strand:+ start:171 stop:1814 length:1644 start_codon:yes stop_codon:yes gene_type:complete